jgi:hypothetical protein
MSIYTENGYSSREEYLSLLRLDYGEELVNRFVPCYQPSQDFDELIRAITDAYYYGEREVDLTDDEEEEEDDDDDDWTYDV